MSYADRVRAGVALLDERHPGWHNRIDLSVLKMQDCYTCVLGQLFESYAVGANALGVGFDDEVFFGFDSEVVGGPSMTRGYRVLNRLWAYVIRNRQAGAS